MWFTMMEGVLANFKTFNLFTVLISVFNTSGEKFLKNKNFCHSILWEFLSTQNEIMYMFLMFKVHWERELKIHQHTCINFCISLQQHTCIIFCISLKSSHRMSHKHLEFICSTSETLCSNIKCWCGLVTRSIYIHGMLLVSVSSSCRDRLFLPIGDAREVFRFHFPQHHLLTFSCLFIPLHRGRP